MSSSRTSRQELYDYLVKTKGPPTDDEGMLDYLFRQVDLIEEDDRDL